jgi:hypothetical protein
MKNVIIKTRQLNYKSKKFLKGLEKIRKENELLSEKSIPDTNKMRIKFNI